MEFGHGEPKVLLLLLHHFPGSGGSQCQRKETPILLWGEFEEGLRGGNGSSFACH